MKTFWSSLQRFVREEDAPTLTEYALMASLIAAVTVGVVTLIGKKTTSLYAVKF